MRHRTILIGVAMVWATAIWLPAQGAPTVVETTASSTVPAVTLAGTAVVRGRVEVIGAKVDGAKILGTKVDGTAAIGAKDATKSRRDVIPGTVVWLTPLAVAGNDAPLPSSNATAPPIRLVQKDKSFDPHILVVPAGSMVEFPNRDPFFHNVFSLFDGKRFDLGLYEAGSSRTIRFDRPGISYIFCNIHPQMSAVIITMATPFYAIANAEGQLSLTGVPYGRYTLHIWSEGMGPENVQPQTREITIAEGATSLGVVRVPQTDRMRAAHKNKYGRDYEEPTPDNSVYRLQR